MSDEIYQKTFEDHYYESERLNIEARKTLLELKKEVEKLQAENAELRAILKNFLTESECKRTWLEEMQATIETLLEEQSE